jgi:hypothetical protein
MSNPFVAISPLVYVQHYIAPARTGKSLPIPRYAICAYPLTLHVLPLLIIVRYAPALGEYSRKRAPAALVRVSWGVQTLPKLMFKQPVIRTIERKTK